MTIDLHFIEQSAIALSLLLIFCYGASSFGWMHWLCDLLSNFKVQYAAGGLILWATLLLFHHYLLSAIVIALAICAYWDTRKVMQNPKQFDPPTRNLSAPSVSILVYNKLFRNRRKILIISYLKKKHEHTDIILVIEALDSEENAIRTALSTTHPHTLPPHIPRPDYIQIYSKHPLKSLELRQVAEGYKSVIGLRTEIIHPTFKEPISFYTTHGEIPIGGRRAAKQFQQFKAMSEWIAQDKNKYVLFAGDWNTTPYTNIHRMVRGLTGLRYQNFGLLPETTWPAWLFLPFLKIPIDHILFSAALNLVEIRKRSHLWSDHHSLYAVFEVE